MDWEELFAVLSKKIIQHENVNITNISKNQSGTGVVFTLDSGETYEVLGLASTEYVDNNIGNIGVIDFAYTRSGTTITGNPTTTINIADLVENRFYMIDGDWAVSNAWIFTDTIKYALSDGTEINLLSQSNVSGIGKVADLKQVMFPFNADTGNKTIFLAKLIKKNSDYFFAVVPSVSGQDIVSVDGEVLVDYDVGDLDFNYNDGQKFFCISGGNASYTEGHIYKANYNFQANTVSFTDMTKPISTTYTTILPTTAESYTTSGTNKVLSKTLTGLKTYDAFLLETNDVFTNTYNGSISLTNDTITFTLNSVPSSEMTLTYTIIKCKNGGVL